MALAIGNLLDTGGRAKHRFNAIFLHPNFATSIFKRRKNENRMVILTFVVLRKD